MSLRIRTAISDDVHAIATIHVASWKAAYRGIMPDKVLDALSVEQRQSTWEELFSKETVSVLVAGKDNAIVGWIDYGLCRDEDDPDS